MSWARLDDRFHGNPKVMRAWRECPEAIGLYVMGITYCAQHETDGLVDEAFVLLMVAKPRDAVRIPAILEKHGLWDRTDAGWHIGAFLEFNPSKDENETRRGWDRKRKELFRDPDLVDAIRKRDGDRCRYCATKVNWKDRRSSTGGTYDHVEPRGANTYENVVVACKGCNSAKGGRTPEQAGMPLLPPGVSSVSSSGLDHDLHTRPDPSRPVPDDKGSNPQEGSPLRTAGSSHLRALVGEAT